MFQHISSCHTTFEVYTITTYELLKGSNVVLSIHSNVLVYVLSNKWSWMKKRFKTQLTNQHINLIVYTRFVRDPSILDTTEMRQIAVYVY